MEHHAEEEEQEMFTAVETRGDNRLRSLGALTESGHRPQRGGDKGASAPSQQSAHSHSERHI